MNDLLMPTYFLSHGGGPWPWLKEEMPFYENLEKSLQAIPGQLPRVPEVILVISGHWETKSFSVMSNANPPMLYDYIGSCRKNATVNAVVSGALGAFCASARRPFGPLNGGLCRRRKRTSECLLQRLVPK